jgi:hypothetical protein
MRPRALRNAPWPAAVLPAAVLLTGVTAGCASHGPAAAGPAPSAAGTAGVVSAADLHAAQFAILRLADMGAGYQQTPYQSTAQTRADNAALSRCVGLPAPSVHQTAQVFSDQLSQGNLEILASIAFVATSKTARADLAAFRGARAAGCITQAFLTQYRRTGGKATASAGPLRPSPAGSAPAAGYRLKVLAQTTGGSSVPVFLDVVRVIKGRAEVLATFQDENQPVPAAVERHAISVMLGRL